MEVKKVLKVATAIAASASFIGATLLGAVAQDLSTYPAPFVNNGVFDAFIVVGANAQPVDIVGAVDVGASLQFSLKQATTQVGASSATIDNGVMIQKSGNKFVYGNSISSVEGAGASLSQDDLPLILADGKYVDSEGTNTNSVTYTQRLAFNTNTTASLVYTEDDRLAPNAGDYLYIQKDQQLYNYSLEFDSPVVYDDTTSADALNDWKTTTLNIEGKTYTVTDLSLTASLGKLSSITLLSGEAVLWLTQDNPITKTVDGVQHTIEVLSVTEPAVSQTMGCQVQVDDVTAIIDVDSTQTINGVQIGVTDARAIRSQLQDTNVCQLSIGASQIELKDGDQVQVDGTNLEGSMTTFHEATNGQFEGFDVVYNANDLTDDKYLTAGQEFIDPVFQSWKIVYGGLTANYENYTIRTSGSANAYFDFINNAGKQVEIPMYMNKTGAAANNKIFLGRGSNPNQQLLATGTGISGADIPANISTSSVSNLEGVDILATTPTGEAHVFEISSIDTNKNQTNIQDLTNGRTFDNLDYTPSIYTQLSLGSFGSLNVDFAGSAISAKVDLLDNTTTAFVGVSNTVPAKVETHALGSISLADINGGNVTISLSELDRNGNAKIPVQQPASVVSINVYEDTTSNHNGQIDVGPASATNVTATPLTLIANNVNLAADNSNYEVLVTPVGTVVTSDNNNYASVVIQMPTAEVYGNVFIAPIVAQLTGAAGGSPAYTISKLNVGAAKLDSDVTDITADNLIIIGGPCANSVAAKALGLTYPACGTASGIAANTAIIKEVAQSTGKVSLVVAGYSADDTQRATRVLSNYNAYNLTGSSVTVTGTSLTDIQVSKSA